MDRATAYLLNQNTKKNCRYQRRVTELGVLLRMSDAGSRIFIHREFVSKSPYYYGLSIILYWKNSIIPAIPNNTTITI